jgi:hypothetical protein
VTTPRRCYYTNEAFATRADGKVIYQLALIEEGAPGYSVSYTSEYFETVKAMARSGNEGCGLSEADVLDIVASSMAAGPVRT